MPRTSKGSRFWKRPARRKNGKVVASSVWIIKDDGKHISTGCAASPSGTRPPAEAERALADYIANKYTPVRKERNVDNIDIADVRSIYRDDKRNGFEADALKRKFDNRIASRRHANSQSSATKNSGVIVRLLQGARQRSNSGSCRTAFDSPDNATRPRSRT